MCVIVKTNLVVLKTSGMYEGNLHKLKDIFQCHTDIASPLVVVVNTSEEVIQVFNVVPVA